MKVYTPRTYT